MYVWHIPLAWYDTEAFHSKSQGPCLESESSYYATRSLEVKMEIKGVKAFYT